MLERSSMAPWIATILLVGMLGACSRDDHDHADERVLLVNIAARIFELVKVSQDFVERDANRGHEQPPCDPRVGTRRSKLQSHRAWRNSFQIARTAQSARWPWSAGFLSSWGIGTW